MLIDNVNIEEYNAELIDRIISTTHINSYTDWMDEATEGILLRQAYDWRNIRLTFLVKEKQREDAAYKNISALTQALKNCNIHFDDINLDFRCILTGSTQPERLQNGVFKIVYDLKNDWGRGDKIIKEWTISPAAGKRIKVNYVRNWAPTMESYTICFDGDEVQERLGTDDIYVDLSLVEELAERNTSWSEFFLELGVPVNKYKQANELNGFLDIDIAYSAEEAKHILDTRDTFTIYYNRFHKDGYADFPGPKTYPSLVWQTGDSNRFYFDCGVGQGWNVQDITVNVIGRYYKASAASNGGMFGAYTDPYGLVQKGSDAYFNAGGSYTQAVFNEDGSTGNGIAIGTLEDLASLPLREYAIKSSNEGGSPIVGYVNFIFNGVTLTRNSCASQVLTNNITVGIAQNVHDAKTELAQNCDIARVRIYCRGQLVRDLIPINGNLKNCFINNYDTGMYDVISMKYVGWKNYNSGVNGPNPGDGYMNIPGMPDTPLPPPAPNTYSVTIVNGTGSGNYEEGALVTINANEPSNNTLIFDKWVVASGNVTLSQDVTSKINTFTMVPSAVTITATYKKINPDTPVDPPTDIYSVTVNQGSGSGNYKQGVTVTINADNPPDDTFEFDKWTIDSGNVTLSQDVTNAVNTFIMVAANVVVTATYKKRTDTPTPPPEDEDTYPVTVVNGVGSGYYKQGELVTVSANLPSDSRLQWDKWVVNNGNVTLLQDATNMVNTFIMPSEMVIITAAYTEIPTQPVEPEIDATWHYYWNLEDAESEIELYEKAKSWDEATTFLNFYAIFSVPNVGSKLTKVTWAPYGTEWRQMSMVSAGTVARDGRYYVELKPNGTVGSYDAYIEGTYLGQTVRKDFYINSLT